MLQQVVNSMPMYLIQILQSLKRILGMLARIFNGFLWDQNVESRRIHWSSWEHLCFLRMKEG